MPAWCDEKWKLERHRQLAVARERFEDLAQQLAETAPVWVDELVDE